MVAGMWDSLWHLRGSLPIYPEDSDSGVLGRVEALLAVQGKSLTEEGGDFLAFRDPLGFNTGGNRWSAMAIYDQGRFWIERGNYGQSLRFDLRSLHGFLFCLAAAAVVFAFGLSDGGMLRGFRFAAVGFTWLYGMNMLLAWVRVPRAIRLAILGS